MGLTLGEEVMLVPNLITASQALILMIESDKFTDEDVKRQASVVQEKIHAFASR